MRVPPILATKPQVIVVTEPTKGARPPADGGLKRRELAMMPAVLGVAGSGPASAQPATAVGNASLSDLQEALAQGRVTSSELTRAYLARIEAYDRQGPGLNSVRTTNPDALSIAASLDTVKPSATQAIAGLPILVKDNIATGDRQPTTAGSLALGGAYARDDAPVVRKLREAGAVILGKANLTEFANVLAVGMPSGYSSIAGYVRNPYSPKLMSNEAPAVLPGGSSAGSAVAVAAGLCAAAIGTETSGSLLSPATQNGLVTVKPTVGLISRSGIIPISHSQDTAGPMTRTVRDSAILLNVLAARDPDDPETHLLQRPDDYTSGLDKDGLKGARIGVPSDPDDPLNDPFYGPLSPRAREVMAQAIKVLEELGATVVRAAIPAIGWIGGPGTTMPVLNRNPFSPTRGTPGPASIVFLYELKRDLNLYLRDWATNTQMKTMADIIAFNAENADKALRYGQDLFLAAEATRGDLSELEYKSARAMDLMAAKERGMDAYMNQHRLDAVVFPGASGSTIAAKPGYPSVQVPAGFISGVGKTETPDYPLGFTFAGRAWSEATLLRLAYAYEQATNARRPPPDLPAL